MAGACHVSAAIARFGSDESRAEPSLAQKMCSSFSPAALPMLLAASPAKISPVDDLADDLPPLIPIGDLVAALAPVEDLQNPPSTPEHDTDVRIECVSPVKRSHAEASASDSEDSLESAEAKRAKRMRRNRESAAISRERKKAHIATLEQRVKQLEATVAMLRGQNVALQAERAAVAAGVAAPVVAARRAGAVGVRAGQARTHSRGRPALVTRVTSRRRHRARVGTARATARDRRVGSLRPRLGSSFRLQCARTLRPRL